MLAGLAKKKLHLILAAVAFAVTALSPYQWAGLILVGLTLAAVLYTYRKGRTTNQSAVHLILASALLPAYAKALPSFPDFCLLATAVLLLGLITQEGLLARLERPGMQHANLGIRKLTPTIGRRTTALNSLVLGLVLASVIFKLPSWISAVVVALILGTVAGVAMLSRRRAGGHEAAAVRLRLERTKPVFALYYSAPAGSEYQVTMWLPYLDRLGLPYMIVLREGHALSKLAKLTQAPIVVAPSIEAVEEAIVPSLTTMFYVNNGMKNIHSVRFAQLTHIQLLHGDSDKPPSYNPVTAMFDKIFVAGQAGIDRYAKHGVNIDPGKFVVVGRPQVESVEVMRQPERPLSEKVVLYAPTWTGFFADTNYCSLPVAQRILEHLLELGATVILRAHPYTAKNAQSAAQLAGLEQLLDKHRQATGKDHLWGSRSTTDMTIFECFNQSDVLIADVSSAVSDYLFSEKPFAIVDMVGEGERFAETFPLAEAGYVVRNDLSNLEQAMSDLLVSDPKRHIRQSLKRHYLGPFPADSYAGGFVSAARQIVLPLPGANSGQVK